MEISNKELLVSFAVLFYIGFLGGAVYEQEQPDPKEGLTTDYFGTVRGVFLPGNVVCYDYTPHHGVDTKAEEEIHMLINTNSDVCNDIDGNSEGCYAHFCGEKQ